MKEKRKRKKEIIEGISQFFLLLYERCRPSNEKISVSQQNLCVNYAYYLCGPLTKCSILQF